MTRKEHAAKSTSLPESLKLIPFPYKSAEDAADHDRERGKRERETTGYEYFALHAIIQWVV